MSSFTTRRVAAFAALALIIPIGTGIAFADQLETDGDIIDGPSEILFGDICAGASSAKQASLAIRRQGNNNVFANGANVTFATPTITGHTSVTAATPPAIALTGDWATSTSNNQSMSAIVTANIMITAGSTPIAARQAVISYTGTGPQHGSTTPLSRGDLLTVKWNVVSCVPADTTPPVVTVPGDQTLEATSSAGAPFSFTATANDNLDGSVAATCDATSGSIFPIGSTTVSCSAQDAAGNVGGNSFSVTVEDTTPPSVSASTGETAEATSAAGAVVDFADATAFDIVDGPLAAPCVPSSGSLFALGVTAVECTAIDHSGNPGSSGFTVTVVDTTAPSVDVPATITLEATSPAGATADFTATANDIVDGVIVPTCTPPSGSVFALGTTSGTCSATDDAGNQGSSGFTVTVEDTTAPVLIVPAPITVDPTGITGAAVTYSTSADDIVDGAVATICSPASGSTFTFGSTTVNCEATDLAGNTSLASFTVTVSPLGKSGFFQPVDMGTSVWNTMKNGSTVPLKFRLSAGSTDLTTTSAVAAFSVKQVVCPNALTATFDEIEFTTTGGTALRYDATGGQFIQNWQTPKKVGACYQVTMTAVDSSTIVANFKLK